MTIRLYTPGHSPYTDTLILYGLARVFAESENGNVLTKVNGIGGTYYLEADLSSYDEAAECICNFIENHENTFKRVLSSNLGSFDEGKLDIFLQALTNVDEMKNYLQSLSTPGHGGKEGRGRHGTTIPLPLMPTAGKYLHKDLTSNTKFSSTPYVACINCLALAALGLAEATIFIRAKGQWGVIILSIPFEGDVSPYFFSQFFEFRKSQFDEENSGSIVRRLYNVVNQVPVKTLTLLTFSLMDRDVLRSMSEMQARWLAFSVFLTGKPKAPQVRGVVDLEISSFIRNLSLLYEKDVNFMDLDRLLFFLASKGDVAALEGLFTFISSKDLRRFYQFARETYSTIERWKKDKDPRERNRAEQAAACFSMSRNIAIGLLR